MTTEQILSAIFLSILSSPSKAGIYDNLSNDPVETVDSLSVSGYEVQEHVAGVYGSNPVKASEKILERCLQKNVRVLAWQEADYPPFLKEIHRPPLVIYTKGKLNHDKLISIVGTRNSDRKSEEITLKIASDLSVAGYTIVSGLAYGIDRFAHLGALNSGGGTVGVLPGGIDTIYPYRNRDLYGMIANSDKSAVISEYPPGITPGQKWTFAQRNRIISGLSPALIIIQAPRGSGAMITARYAIEQNRELFVCPGNTFDQSYEGCNDLIRDGATILSRMDDLLSEIDPDYPREECSTVEINSNPGGTDTPAVVPVPRLSKKTPDLSAYSGIERVILEGIISGVTDIDTLARRHSCSPEEMNGAITLLEIEGAVSRKGNELFLKLE